MQNIILLTFMLFLFSSFSDTATQEKQKEIQQPSKAQQTVSIEAAQKYFAEKNWDEALKAYERILPSLKGEDLEKANDRLGDINFFLGHHKKSSAIYAMVGQSVLARSYTFIKQSSKFVDKGNYRKAEPLMKRANVLNTLSSLIRSKMYLVDALPTGDIDKYAANIRPLVEEVKQRISNYIFLYHGVLTKKGFDLNANKFNAEIDKLNRIKSELKTTIDKFDKIIEKDSTKTK